MLFSEEDECQFAGGPFDGQTLSIPREFNEWTFPKYAASVVSSWQDAMPNLQRVLADVDPETMTEEAEAEIDDRVIAELQRSHEAYAKPPAGGILYRRIPGNMSFEFVRDLTPDEHRAWKLENLKIRRSDN